MYGTVARFRVKPGMEAQMQADMKSYESVNMPGYQETLVYKMDSDSNEYYMAVVFDSKESYVKNADDPAQDARYRKMLEYMDGEPEWHDGEIVYSQR
jgi:heme-degrading monooxygenase HmoA